MPDNHCFNDIRIPPDSPIVDLGIPAGNYSGEFDSKQGKLLLRKRDGKPKDYSMSVTVDQLLVLLMMLQRDKFTLEELEIIKRIKRSSSFSGSDLFPAHHIIPVDVCKNSKLIVQAIKLNIFEVNGSLNRLPLPAYFHNEGGHKKYSNFIAQILEDEWKHLVDDRQEYNEEAIRQIVDGAIPYFRELIEEKRKLGVTSIEDVFSRWD